MRLSCLIACLCVLGVAGREAVAQIPAGEYLRNYSPGYSGETLTISDDSTVIRREWTDVTIVNHPSALYRGDTGTLMQSGQDLFIRYRSVLLDSTEWESRSDWAVPVEEWASHALEASQNNRSRLVVDEIDGATVLAWATDAAAIGSCRESLSEPKPEEVLESLDWYGRRVRSCGQVFLPPALQGVIP